MFSLNVGAGFAVHAPREKDPVKIGRSYYSTLFTALGFAGAASVATLLAAWGLLSSEMVGFVALALLVAYTTTAKGYTTLMPSAFQHTRVAAATLVLIVRSIGFTFHIDWGLVRGYLRLSMPLVPYSFSGWLMDISDKYVLWFFLGIGAVGAAAASS